MAFKYKTFEFQPMALLTFLFLNVFLAKGSEELEADLNKNQTVSARGNRTTLSTCYSTSDVYSTYQCCAPSYASAVKYSVLVPSDSDDNFYARVCTDSSCDYLYPETKCKVSSNNQACAGDACEYYAPGTQYDCKLSQISFGTQPYKPCFRFSC